MWDIDEIGKNVTLLRIAQGFTQEEVALQSHISVSRLQDIEYGCPNVTVDTILYIAKTLHVDSQVLGIFLKSDEEILSQIHKTPRLPELPEEPLQVFRNIVLLRNMEGLTQMQLAHMSNISVARLRDIEHGCANVTINKSACIAKTFGMSMSELNTVTMSDASLLNLVHRARAVVGITET